MQEKKVGNFMKKTLKQLADELGVTKQTVQYHFRSLQTKYSYKNDKDIFVLYEEGQEIIRNKINKFANKEKTKETVRNEKKIIMKFFKAVRKKDEQIKLLLENQNHLQKLFLLR